ncbi:MAG: Ig domain-containing protein, partial [Candidatus Nanopelagicales bacterium]
ITPTVSALPTVASFKIDGEIPEGLTFNPRTGVISGVALVRDNIVYEPTITALDAAGQPLTSTWSSITVIKPAVPMHVKARAAKKKLGKKTTVVTTVRHPKNTTLSAEVFCTGCTWTFNKKSGQLTIKKPKKKTQVTVRIITLPKGAKAKQEFAGHEWYRTWKVR